LLIEIKESDATDQDATGSKNPTNGWVKLRNFNDSTASDYFTIQGAVVGTARGIYSCARLLYFTQTGKVGRTGGTFLPRAKYDVRVTALDAANTDSRGVVLDRIRTELYFAAAIEVQKARMTLPHNATATITVSNLEAVPEEPIYAWQSTGRKVWIPESTAAWDSETKRHEPGSMTWSRNPVWCKYDLVTNPHFGAGEYFTWQHVGLTRALAAATFCDETLADGEVRSEVDIVLRIRAALWDHVGQIAAGSRVLPALTGGTWQSVIDQDETSVMTITEDDIQDGQVKSYDPSIESLPTEIEAAFTDEDAEYELSSELRRRPGEPDQRVTRRIDLTGVRRRSQVGRAIDLELRHFEYDTQTDEILAARWKALLLEAGDIVTFTSTTANASAAKRRVTGVAFGSTLWPALRLQEHNPEIYNDFAGPNSAIKPGTRPPPSSGTSNESGASISGGLGQTFADIVQPYLVLARLTLTKIKGKGSVWYRCDIGPLPKGADHVVVRYREEGDAGFTLVGSFTESPFEFKLPNVGRVEIETYAVGRDGKGDVRKETIDTTIPIESLPLPSTLTLPTPSIDVDGPALKIVQEVPDGEDPKDYEIEAVQVPNGGNVQDGLHLGFWQPGQEIPAHAWPATGDAGVQEVHTRLVRLEDSQPGSWLETSLTVPQPAIDHTEGHSTDFASGTIDPFVGSIASLEVAGGDLQFIDDLDLGDLSTDGVILSDLSGMLLGQLRDLWTPSRYQTATVTLDHAEDIQLQIQPIIGTITRANPTLGDLVGRRLGEPLDDISGTYTDRRAHRLNNLLSGDTMPMEIDVKVKKNGAGSYEKYTPGQVLQGITSYNVQLEFTVQRATQMAFDKLLIRHWIFCKYRPWCTHSRAFELIHENTLAANAATYDIAVTGDDYEEMLVEVRWKNAQAGATTLWLRPNNDGGNNYNLDGGADTKVVVGGNTVAQNEWEYAVVRFHNPKNGAERAITVESNARWTATTSDSSDAADTYVWTDNSNAITSIRVLTAGGATLHLASGSITRVWGKRYYTE
jgi:hypothetical protein